MSAEISGYPPLQHFRPWCRTYDVTTGRCACTTVDGYHEGMQDRVELSGDDKRLTAAPVEWDEAGEVPDRGVLIRLAETIYAPADNTEVYAHLTVAEAEELITALRTALEVTQP